MPHRNNARLVAGTCVTVIVLALLVLGGLSCYEWGKSSASAVAATKVDEVNGCRAAYRAKLVDQPTLDALAAVARKNETALRNALAEGDLDRYRTLIGLSQTNPDGFLAQCRRDGLGRGG